MKWKASAQLSPWHCSSSALEICRESGVDRTGLERLLHCGLRSPVALELTPPDLIHKIGALVPPLAHRLGCYSVGLSANRDACRPKIGD